MKKQIILFILIILSIHSVSAGLFDDYSVKRLCVGNEPVYKENKDRLTLIENKNAENPTYDELIEFLEDDKTDENHYCSPDYTCGDFAEDVHNSAEIKGIKAGIVIKLSKDRTIAHCYNLFNTVDKDIVYVDCSCGYDKIVDLKRIDGVKYYRYF